MSIELPNQEHAPTELQKDMHPQQQVVEAAVKLAAVAIEASLDQGERTALVDTLKAELGPSGIIVHDMEDRSADERRGRSGFTRDQILMMRKSRVGRQAVRRSRLGWKT